jgi:hypothetical protein
LPRHSDGLQLVQLTEDRKQRSFLISIGESSNATTKNKSMPNPAYTPNTVLSSSNLIIDDETTTYSETKTDSKGDKTTTVYEAPTQDFANSLRQGKK